MGRVLAQSSAHRVCTQDASWPADMIRATSDQTCRFVAPICADLLGAFGGDPWRSRALYAICIGPGRGHGDGVRPCPHLIGTGVRYRRQQWQGHAHGRPGGISRAGNEFLLDPLYLRLDHRVLCEGHLPLPWSSHGNGRRGRSGLILRTRTTREESCPTHMCN